MAEEQKSRFITRPELDQRANEILSLIKIEPELVIRQQLDIMDWDSIHILMRFYNCSIQDLTKKVLATKLGKSTV